MKIFIKQTKKLLTGLTLLDITSLIVATLVITPIFNFLIEGTNYILDGKFSLGMSGRKEVFGTLKLLIFTSFFGGGLGILNGWLFLSLPI